MKCIYMSAALVFSALFVVGESYAENESPMLIGPYLGQKPPGSTPEIFAPGIVSTEGWEVSGAFTPELNEFYFIRDSKESEKQEMVVFINTNNRWHESVFSPRVGTPLIAPDGKTMIRTNTFGHFAKRVQSLNEVNNVNKENPQNSYRRI